MNSCLYKATVMHHRFSPKKHRFHYNVFMFYIDLDELEQLSKKIMLFSNEKFNFFTFKRSHHLELPLEKPDRAQSTKEHIIRYVEENGFNYTGQKIMLLTNLSILGYNFNPVSFYFLMGSDNQPDCAVAEVSNTFRELKPYFLSKETLMNNQFNLTVPKHFYVSPFIDHDASFHFQLNAPGEKLNLKIDDYKNGEKIFISTLTGTKTELSNGNLFYFAVRFPFLTLRIITLIHWHAFRLWIKKIPFHPKASFPELQKNVYKRVEKNTSV